MGLIGGAPHTEEKWVADEISTQISEHRKTVQALEKNKPVLPLAGTEQRTLGKTKAPLAIVEFTDYQCPYCRKHATTTLGALLNLKMF